MEFSPRTSSKFFGIYRAVVVDSEDPSNLGRIKMQVPQVTGLATTTWAWPITGAPVQGKVPRGSFIDTQNQPASGSTPTNTAMPILIRQDLGSYAVYLSNDSRINVKYSGTYNIQFSLQLTSTNSSLQVAQIWLAKNGVYVPDTNTQVSISGNGAAAAPAWNFVVDAAAGDYFELYWATDHGTVTVSSGITPLDGAPDVPSVIVTITLSGTYKPLPGDGVWAMFEGGDPNFPLWVGAY